MRVKGFINFFSACGITAVLIMFITACGVQESVETGSTWTIDKTACLTRLTIADGALIRAPEGYSVTMTVDGVEKGIQPGVYMGDIVLTVTKDIPITFRAFNYPHLFRTAVYIENGRYIGDKSVAAAVTDGTVTDASANDISITSDGENFNGIFVTGDSESSYSILNPVIDFTGNGGNDFAGFGAAVMSSGNAEVILENAKIVSRGCIRTAVWAGGNSVMKVNNSYIEVYNGILPEGFEGVISSGKTKEVPWVLGIRGNCRATNMGGSATAYYNNTHIKAQGWGALSTDGMNDGKLYATNCTIEVLESGYGAYADVDVFEKFSRCTFDVPDYGLIMTGGSVVFTDETVVNSGRFGVMLHGSADLTIEKNSVFNTKKAVIQLKSAFADIVVDNAELNSKAGILIQAMINDDPKKAGLGMPGDMTEEMLKEMFGDKFSGGMPKGGIPGSATNKSGITATFRNATVVGDIINAMTPMGEMVVNFENANITGAITTATTRAQVDIDGKTLSRKTYYYIGEAKHTYCSTDDEHGIKVAFDGDSEWIVDKTSYLTGLTISGGASIRAPEGYNVAMMVDGIEKSIDAGDYSGKIVLKVTK